MQLIAIHDCRGNSINDWKLTIKIGRRLMLIIIRLFAISDRVSLIFQLIKYLTETIHVLNINSGTMYELSVTRCIFSPFD